VATASLSTVESSACRRPHRSLPHRATPATIYHNGEIIATGEAYESKASAEKGIASVQKNAADAKIEDLTE